jgi:hypothetical protein
MSWQDDVHLVPSQNRALLESLIGRRVVGLLHYPEDPIDVLLQDYKEWRVTKQQLFANAGGPVVLVFDDERRIGVSYSEELLSVTVWLSDLAEFERDDWPPPIDAADPEYSEPRFERFVGKTITRVNVYQLDLQQTDQPFVVEKESGARRFFMPKALSRPREVELAFGFEPHAQLVISSSIADTPSRFAVTTELVTTELPIAEILTIGASS